MQDEKALVQKHKKTRPKFEDVADSLVKNDVLKNALVFVAFLQENNIRLVWKSTCSWSAEYKGERVCTLHIRYDSYTPSKEIGALVVRPWGYYGGEYENFITSDKDKEIIWASVKQCNACNGRYTGKKRPCNFAKGNDIMIFGKIFESVCGYLLIKNPDSEMLDFAKKWVMAKIQTIKGE